MQTTEHQEQTPNESWREETALRTLYDRYSDAVNRRDWETLRTCWADEGVWDLGTPLNIRKEGIDNIMTEVQRAVNSMAFFMQMPHAVVIASIQGDHANARVSLNEIGRALDGKSGMFILAMYTDDIVRQNGQWRFAKRVYKVAYFDNAAPQGQTFPLA